MPCRHFKTSETMLRALGAPGYCDLKLVPVDPRDCERCPSRDDIDDEVCAVAEDRELRPGRVQDPDLRST